MTQTHDYLMYFLDLLLDIRVFDQHEYIKIWSDGCSKHFKTYPTHYYLGALQERSNSVFSWHFLPPNDAHNRADAAAAHFSGTIRRAIKSSFLLNEIGHLAYISAHMKNWFVFFFPPSTLFSIFLFF